MKRLFLAAVSAFMILALTGCGDGGTSPPPLVVTNILSDPVFDGDIQKDPVTGSIIITQGMSPTVQTVFAGINPFTGVESRAFLDFPLTGVGGVPGNAIIDSAFLDIFLENITTLRLTDTIPLRIDLVSFQPPALDVSKFDIILQPALASIRVTPSISQADFRRHVVIDVTPLMVVAQRLGHLDFQVRIMEDLGIVTPGLIEINDTTGANRSTLAPLLQVTYF